MGPSTPVKSQEYLINGEAYHPQNNNSFQSRQMLYFVKVGHRGLRARCSIEKMTDERNNRGPLK